MLTVDFHTHSHFSHCGIHSIIEMLTEGKRRGLAAMAITDHAGADLGKIPSSFFDRLTQPVEGIRLLKGIECNVQEQEGVIDIPRHFLKYMDIVLLGVHPFLTKGLGVARYTELLIKALEANPYVDIVTHPNDLTYLVDFARVTRCCKEAGIAVELNNSKTMLGRINNDITKELIAACQQAGCRVVINSDAHAINEIGLDTSIRPLLAEVNFPEELIVNRDVASALAFVEERRVKKI